MFSKVHVMTHCLKTLFFKISNWRRRAFSSHFRRKIARFSRSLTDNWSTILFLFFVLEILSFTKLSCCNLIYCFWQILISKSQRETTLSAVCRTRCWARPSGFWRSPGWATWVGWYRETCQRSVQLRINWKNVGRMEFGNVRNDCSSTVQPGNFFPDTIHIFL